MRTRRGAGAAPAPGGATRDVAPFPAQPAMRWRAASGGCLLRFPPPPDARLKGPDVCPLALRYEAVGRLNEALRIWQEAAASTGWSPAPISKAATVRPSATLTSRTSDPRGRLHEADMPTRRSRFRRSAVRMAFRFVRLVPMSRLTTTYRIPPNGSFRRRLGHALSHHVLESRGEQALLQVARRRRQDEP